MPGGRTPRNVIVNKRSLKEMPHDDGPTRSRKISDQGQGSAKRTHRGGAEETRRLARVQVCSHTRQRQSVVVVISLASVSTLFALQNGHMVGRVTASFPADSNIVLPSRQVLLQSQPVIDALA